MGPAFIVFVAALLLVCAFAALRGGADERLAATAIAIAAVTSPLVPSHGFAGPELGIVLVDAGVFVVLAGIAMRSRAFWPMWAAGFQLCALAGHLAASQSPTMLPAAYADTLAIWSYAVIVTLALGTIVEGQERHGRR